MTAPLDPVSASIRAAAVRAARNAGIPVALLYAPTRQRAEICAARHAAMQKAHRDGASIAAIARVFGRDWSSVAGAVKRPISGDIHGA